MTLAVLVLDKGREEHAAETGQNLNACVTVLALQRGRFRPKFVAALDTKVAWFVSLKWQAEK
jgi:hypothetical protein